MKNALRLQKVETKTAKIIQFNGGSPTPQTANTSSIINSIDRTISKIAIPNAEGYDFVHMDDILFLKAEGNYTQIHFTNKKKTLVARTLKSFGKILVYDQYFRSHQTYLVNVNHVEKFYRGSGGYLLLDNGDKIPVARSKREALSSMMHL